MSMINFNGIVFSSSTGEVTNFKCKPTISGLMKKFKNFFANLLDMDIEWKPVSENNEIFEGIDRKTGKRKYSATRVDLIFGSDFQFRAHAEFYAQDDNKNKFIKDFIAAWNKANEP